MSDRKGLTMHVYRHGHTDFTLGGISATAEQLTITGMVGADTARDRPMMTPLPDGSCVVAPTPARPEAWLYLRVIGGPVWAVIPAMTETDLHYPGDYQRSLSYWLSLFMFGGNYAATSDSRIGDITELYGALAIHDRNEFTGSRR